MTLEEAKKWIGIREDQIWFCKRPYLEEIDYDIPPTTEKIW